MPVAVDRHDRKEARRGQLLAVQELRRSLERIQISRPSAERASMAVMATAALRELRELIEALDRRVPQVERAGEASIARDAAALKARALKRIEQLESERTRPEAG